MDQWWEIFAAMGVASALTAIVQHWIDAYKVRHPHEQPPDEGR